MRHDRRVLDGDIRVPVREKIAASADADVKHQLWPIMKYDASAVPATTIAAKYNGRLTAISCGFHEGLF